MKSKHLKNIVSMILASVVVFYYGNVSAETDQDNLSGYEQNDNGWQENAQNEAQKKVMEAQREAQKKLDEANKEKDPAKQQELRREAQKKLDEAGREADKKNMEAARSDEGGKDEDLDEADEYESHVSDSVHKLLEIVNSTEDVKIGEEIKKVAEEQNEQKDDAANAIRKAKERSAVRNFVFGADLKNLGELRSSLTSIENHIRQLEVVKEKATSSPEIAKQLDAEIKALAEEKDKLKTVFDDTDGKIGLIGWIFRLFQ